MGSRPLEPLAPALGLDFYRGSLLASPITKFLQTASSRKGCLFRPTRELICDDSGARVVETFCAVHKHQGWLILVMAWYVDCGADLGHKCWHTLCTLSWEFAPQHLDVQISSRERKGPPDTNRIPRVLLQGLFGPPQVHRRLERSNIKLEYAPV